MLEGYAPRSGQGDCGRAATWHAWSPITGATGEVVNPLGEVVGNLDEGRLDAKRLTKELEMK